MEQAQVFASAWSLVGGRFDGGSAMDDAEEAKSELRVMVASLANVANPPQPKQEQGEPVAWMRHDGQRVTTASDRHNYPDYETRYSIPLYTTPQQRKPLTDEQIQTAARNGQHHHSDFCAGVQFAEAAHGIKETS